MSMQSVSVFGEEVDAEKAVDVVFRELQDTLNQSNCLLREILCCPERNETYMTCVDLQQNLMDYVDDFTNLMKQLKGISKDLLGKCPAELKDEYKAYLNERKAQRDQAKLDKVIERANKLNINKI